jgi:hypothetical protein
MLLRYRVRNYYNKEDIYLMTLVTKVIRAMVILTMVVGYLRMQLLVIQHHYRIAYWDVIV